jgi:hypothetical protein
VNSAFWVARLNAQDAATVWPKAVCILAPVIAGSSGLFTPDDVRDLVTRPNAGTEWGWALWILAEKDQLLGAWATKVQDYPRGRVVEVVFAGGTQMKRWYALALSETEKFAKEIGCDRLRCGGRRGWSRFGWSQLGYLHERKIA